MSGTAGSFGRARAYIHSSMIPRAQQKKPEGSHPPAYRGERLEPFLARENSPQIGQILDTVLALHAFENVHALGFVAALNVGYTEP